MSKELPVIKIIEDREDAQWIANTLTDTFPNGNFSAEQTVSKENWVVCGENDFDQFDRDYLKGYVDCLYEWIDTIA